MGDASFWIHMLTEYGYWIILLGTFLEGETIVIVAGALAHEGYLELPLVSLCAFAGSLCSDQLMFFCGRRFGKPFVERRPALRASAEKVSRWLSGHETLLILGFRFVYGVRNVTPALLGVHGVRPLKFLVLNTLGAALWAVSFAVTGYLFGSALETVFGKLQAGHHVVIILLLLIGLVACIWGFFRFWKRRGQAE